MPITIKKEPSTPIPVTFGSLNHGDCFLWNDLVCIKVRIELDELFEDNYCTAICLKTGTEEALHSLAMVIPVKATLTYSI